jgi:ATP-binding cassette subfamily F protein 3
MSLCTADGLSLAFGRKVILDDVTFAIQPGERIGLVGPNGSGKSTLLRILMGRQEADGGELAFARGLKLGYLPQDVLEIPSGPLLDAVLQMVPGREDIETRVAEIERSLADATDDDERMERSQRLADLHDDLAHFEENHGRLKAERILAGLGFKPHQMERPVGELSGGWKMRVALAGLLLIEPDLLLLDEPTNHLDVPTLTWFDDFLRRSRKALVLISHDREFLNRQIGRVMSFEVEGLRSYQGTYDEYRVQREEEEVSIELRARRQEAERERALRFIERFRAKATKARQVQSRIKQLERQERIVTVQQRARVDFRFPEVARAGQDVLRLEGVRKAWGDLVVYRGVTRTVHRGERIAVIGENGAGKTTLLKLMAGEIAPDAGTVTTGHKVQAAYYAQHHTELLDARNTVLEEIWRLVPDQSQTWVRGVLGAFLFTGDDVDKRISVLSGGERARVALARLLVVPSNLMLLDEPTNHLDLDSCERLIDALVAYGGTLVFVSHNRSFINRLATHVWDVQDQDVVPWPGNLDDWLHHLEQVRAAAAFTAPRASPRHAPPASAAPGPAAAPAPPPPNVEPDKERRRREAEQRQERSRRTRPLREEIEKLEARIAALEAEQKGIEPQLADPDLYADFARSGPLMKRYNEVRDELGRLYGRWEDRQGRLAALEVELARASGT